MTSALENTLIEETAKFDGYKELIEDDLKDKEPGPDVYADVRKNQEEIKKQYLSLKVAQAKYKAKLVSSQVPVEQFNDINSAYKYTDAWLESKKKEYQKLNKNASAFLKGEKDKLSSDTELKFNVATGDEVHRLIKKISTESSQVKAAITDIYSSLEKLDSINLSQAKVYTDSKEELINVLESKIPALIKSMKESAGSEMKEQIEKATVDYDIFESKCKTELYRLAQVIAEKTSHSGSTASERNLSKSDAIHLKKADPPTVSSLSG